VEQLPKVSKEYKEKRRQEILEIAKEVFIQKGFESTTMTDIVKASDLSRGGVYKYFSSTDEMFRAITDQYDQESEGFIEKLLEESKTARQAIEAFLSDSEAGLLKSELGFGIVSYEYFVNSCRNPNRSAYMLKRAQLAMSYFSKIIELGIIKGEFKPTQPTDAIALFIINIMDGLLLYRLVTVNLLNPIEIYIKEQIDGLRMYLKEVLQF
jgi:AcrR family transcriptional regulator